LSFVHNTSLIFPRVHININKYYFSGRLKLNEAGDIFERSWPIFDLQMDLQNLGIGCLINHKGEFQ